MMKNNDSVPPTSLFLAIFLVLVSFNTFATEIIGRGEAVTYSTDQILVKFKEGTTASSKALAHGDKPPVIQHAFKNITGLMMLKLDPDVDVQTALESYRNNPNVVYAEHDQIVGISSTNDTSFNELWGLHNTGQNVNGTVGTADADMNVVEAWANTGVTGSNSVVIAVIDSGVQYNHPDLINNMWVNPGEIAGNGVDDDGNGYIDDVYGINAITNSGDPMDDNNHGTHVAGTIAAVGQNSAGITGVSQQAKILACKFLSASGSGSSSDSLKCLDYIYDLKMSGVNIVVSNNSWGGGGATQAVSDAIELHKNAGILFIAAAGNSSNNNDLNPHYPSNYFQPNLISVAATDQNDNQASFSNYGRRSVHVGAPGVNIYSAIVGSTYSHLQGTSMAAPHVAGLAALLSAEDPTRDWIEIKNLILASGTPTAAINTTTTTGRRIRAWDNDGTGAMTCSNQTVTAVVYPQVSSSTKIGGTKLGLSALNINCAAPGGSVTVTTTGPEAVGIVTLLDNGLEFDKVAADGVYSAYWTAPATTGTYTLTFSNGETQTVSVIANTSTLQSYRKPVSIPFSPRSDAGGYSQVPDNAYFSINSYTAYYQIPIGGVNAPVIYGLPQGINMLSAPTGDQLTGNNTVLPNDGFETLIGGYWDDLDVLTAGYGLKAWAWYNSGLSPVGEVIYEWKARHKTTGNLINFQIVYTAGSSDIEMHYIATDNSAESATVGIQVDWVRASTQSVNEVNPDLDTSVAGKAWKWSLDTGAPTANAGTDQNVSGNSLVTLAGSGTDPDGGDLTYNWVQTAGSLVTLDNPSTTAPSFYAPNVTETLTFKLTVTDDSGQSATDTVNINITAGDPAGSLQLDSATYSVGEDGVNATITVTRTGGSGGTVGVSFATADSSAFAPSDYTYSTGTLSWADGDSASKTFTIPVIDDSVIESNETVSLFLLNATGGATLGVKNATLTIVDNDNVGSLSFSQTTYSVNETGVTATITVSRSGGSVGAVTVDYATADGTATAGSDYTASSGTLSWTSGDSADKTFSVAVTDDTDIESNETVSLTLSNETGGVTLGISSASLTIVENDVAVYGALSLSSSTYSVNENMSSITITVSRTGGSDGQVSVNYETVAGTALAGTDFVSTNGTLTWNDGDTANKTFSVLITDDQLFEGNETFSLTLSSAVGGATIGTNTGLVTIVENEWPQRGTLSINESSVVVAENGATVNLTVSRVDGSDGSVSVVVASVNDTAVAGEDYSSVSSTLSWGDGESDVKTITISILDDFIYEGDEVFTVGLSGVTGSATLGTSSASITITENEIEPLPLVPGTIALTATSYSVTEGDESVTISVVRNNGVDGALSINYSIAAGTATLDSDFTNTSGILSWADGDASVKTFTIIILDDETFETDETVNIIISNLVGDGALGTSSAVLTISDNDAEPNLAPGIPELIAPENAALGVDGNEVTFQWYTVTDPENDVVTYEVIYCVNADFSGCEAGQLAKMSVTPVSIVAGSGMMGLGLAMFGLVGSGSRRRRLIQSLSAVVIILLVSGCGTNTPLPGADGTDFEVVTGLESSTTYYWKVVATDSAGNASTSEVWSFTTL